MIMRAETTSGLNTESHASACDIGPQHRKAMFGLGFRSMLRVGFALFGSMAARFHRPLAGTTRLEHGLIIILPGIEGCSSINDSIARGLVAGQLPHAIRIIDWRRFRPWNPLHLTMERHNRTQARVVAGVITDYQRNFPGRPVHLIGHSAGAGMALFALEQLPAGHSVTSVTLMAAAVSRNFDVARLLDRTRFGIWNFYSPLDLPTVGLGTIIFGTMDRRHGVSAGALGFQVADESTPSARNFAVAGPKLHQVRFRLNMIKCWNFGGHFGSTNAVFVRRHIAPILLLR